MFAVGAHVDGLAVRLNDVLANGQPQTRATGVARTRLVHAIESLEHPRQVFFPNANACVGTSTKMLSSAS